MPEFRLVVRCPRIVVPTLSQESHEDEKFSARITRRLLQFEQLSQAFRYFLVFRQRACPDQPS